MADKRDEMWELDELLPKRRTTGSGYGRRKPEEAAELQFGDPNPGFSGAAIPKRQAESAPKDETEAEYVPDNSLILNVKIKKWPIEYTFYDRFLVDANKYYRYKCEKTPFVPYFSYLPQYNQMNIDQLRYYLYWRSEVANGNYIQTDYSYIFLYFYELINLETVSEPSKRLAAMCSLLKGYRRRYARLDKYAGEWICDFCLIHRLPPPLDLLADELADITPVVGLREFYIGGKKDVSDIVLYDLVTRNNTYDYKQSASYDEKTAPLYDKHIINAVVYAIEKTEHIEDGRPLLAKTRVVRNAYNGALCVSGAKKKIEIDYLSLNRSYRFRGMITSLVKCAENHLRTVLGVRGRLTVKGISSEAAEAIAEYFDKNNVRRPKKTAAKEAKETEETDLHRYDAQIKGIDRSEAERIESGSWELTKRLVGDEAEETEPERESGGNGTEERIVPEKTAPSSPYETLCASLAYQDLCVLRLLSEDKTVEAAGFCKKAGVLFDAAVSDINDAAFDLTGDILIENGTVIEDYADELRAALAASDGDRE